MKFRNLVSHSLSGSLFSGLLRNHLQMTFLFITASGRKGLEGVTATPLKKSLKKEVSLTISLVQKVETCEEKLKRLKKPHDYTPYSWSQLMLCQEKWLVTWQKSAIFFSASFDSSLCSSCPISGGIRVIIPGNVTSSYLAPRNPEVVVIFAFGTHGRRIWSLGNSMSPYLEPWNSDMS